jgi:exodeoxyribonuclease-3
LPLVVATWNVNSIKQRLEHALRWLGERRPDVVCLQEIKCVDEAFPASAFEDLGYNVVVHGQKGFNGVALLSKRPMESVTRGLPAASGDEQSRYVEAVVQAGSGVVRVASIYLPNGNPVGTEKFSYKLAWMNRLRAHAAALLAHEEPVVLAGDFNVIPTPIDCNDPAMWSGDALFQPETRAAWRAIEALGYTDALRATCDAGGVYTFWDYQAGAFQRNWGIRIDHALLSPQAADRLVKVEIDRHTRTWDKPSDHVPVAVTLDLG